ncbi:glutathione S-transferase [Pelagophyceae sp. CCMP2097]|nr:glutathione S-transferase [Pelagophyceae sp. CCMP2097]
MALRLLAFALCAAQAAGLVLPAAAVRVKPMPVLYVYDHCPFCVRVRLALGLKGVKYDVRFLANDDVDLPTSLVGKKISPIFEDGLKAPFAESLDIVAYVDGDARYGPTGLFKPASMRTDLKAWQKTVQTPLRLLQRPRYVKTLLPEFAFQSSRDAFVKNHQLPPYEKADWKSDALTMEQRWALYEASLLDTPALVKEVNDALLKLEPLIHCDECATEGGLSLDDIDLWARLRSLTIVKGVVFPPTVRAYLDYFSKAGDCPLYDAIAL